MIIMTGTYDFDNHMRELGYVEIAVDHSLPESYPAFPYERPSVDIRPETIEGEEIEAAHAALDVLGVPRQRTLTSDETLGGVPAIHELRLHGRLRLLSERLASLGVQNLFPTAEISTTD